MDPFNIDMVGNDSSNSVPDSVELRNVDGLTVELRLQDLPKIIEEVLNLHECVDSVVENEYDSYCSECRTAYPCGTIRAIKKFDTKLVTRPQFSEAPF